MAGKRLGKEDDRHLWPEMLRAIREIQPRWIVGENVLGLVNWSGGLVFHEVQADLEAQGYEVQPFVLPAVSVNAPHRRDRVWFVAHRYGNGLNRSDSEHEEQSGEGRVNAFGHANEGDGDGNVADTNGCTTGTSREGGRIESDWGADYVQQGERREQTEQHNRSSSFSWDAADTNGIGLRGESDGIGNSRFFGQNDKASNWENFPTVSPICDGNDGISDRLDGITFSKWRQESIKAGGNAVVPQVVLQIFRTIEEYEKTHAQ
jgi:DNA (cytosine-5)-methyltransferase 1